MDRMVKEAIEIQLHPNNFSRDTGFPQSPFMIPGHECNKTDDSN
jgi:hypothetical protein